MMVIKPEDVKTLDDLIEYTNQLKTKLNLQVTTDEVFAALVKQFKSESLRALIVTRQDLKNFFTKTDTLQEASRKD